MNSTHETKRSKRPRIPVTPGDIEHLVERHGTSSASVLAKRTGLPYMMVYNLLNRRVQTISHRHYQMLFGGPPPSQQHLKVDGSAFRSMVDLWLYLNDRASKVDLFKELHGSADGQPVDYRLFSGQVSTIDTRLEYQMRSKFAEAGLDGPMLAQWLDELSQIEREKMVPFSRIRPVLAFLQEHLGVHPTAVLNQSVARYQSGMLKRVSTEIYERACKHQEAVKTALPFATARDLERIKESIVGGKTGYTLFAEIEEELDFLCRFAGKRAKHYLGRGPWMYATGRAKRIATWRADQILADCEKFIDRSPVVKVRDLPSSIQRRQVQPLTDVLKQRINQRLAADETTEFEQRILRPLRTRAEYSHPRQRFTPFEMAPRTLGMRRKAFDLMVAKNCEIFRTVSKFEQRWYLPDLYLNDLARHRHFRLISDKYEWMARQRNEKAIVDACMN